MNALAGGTLFPGEHNRADFSVGETDDRIDFSMTSRDDGIKVGLKATHANNLPTDSIFDKLEDSSEFFRGGALGYSVTRDQKHLDGITLETKKWKVTPLEVESVTSTFYDDRSLFPEGTIEFDHALIMQNVEHEWHSAPSYFLR